MDFMVNIPPINSPDPNHQKQLRTLLERLKTSDVGLNQAVQGLEKIESLSSNDEFFWLMVLENQVKLRYSIKCNNNLLNNDIKINLRKLLLNLVKFHVVPTPQCAFSTPILTKIAVIMTKVFMLEYLSNDWLSFFRDIWSMGAIDTYLRVLEQVDNEVVDRTFENLKSQQEQQHSTSIKDKMREADIPEIVLNLQHIITTSFVPDSKNNNINSAAHSAKPAISSTSSISLLSSSLPIPNSSNQTPEACKTKTALKILSRYISWIDIDLIVGNSFIMQFLFGQIQTDNRALRESACTIFTAMFAKGMLPTTRLNFVTTIFEPLQPLFSKWISQVDNLDEEDVDFVKCISECISQIIDSLCFSYKSIDTSIIEPGHDSTNDKQVQAQILQLLDDGFIKVAIELLHNEWNDVGESITSGIKEYLEVAKKRAKPTCQHPSVSRLVLTNLLQGIIKKMRHDDDYDYEDLDDEEETDLALFMRDLNHMYEGIGILDNELVLKDITDKVTAIPELENNDLELVLRLVENLGDSVPTTIDIKNTSPQGPTFLIDTITKIISMNILKPSGHVGVHCKYYCMIVRYERLLFQTSKDLNHQLLPGIISSLLDERGIAHRGSKSARSYCCIVFSRIIRTALNMSGSEQVLTEDISTQILNTICGAITSYEADDRLYLFEIAALLAVRTTSEPRKWCTMLVEPCLEQLKTRVQNAQQRITVTSYIEAELEQANHYISCITRTSKAFTNKSSMEAKNCEDIFLKSLKIFLEVLTLEEKIQVHIRPNIKQFVHRMVICLQKHSDAVICPSIIQTLEQASTGGKSNPKLLVDLIPILSQVLQKYATGLSIHKFCWPKLAEICYNSWNCAVDVNDEELESDCKYVRRSYYNIVAIGLANKQWLEILAGKEDLQNFMGFLLDGVSIDLFCDPQTAKCAISCLITLAENWVNASSDIAKFLVVEVCPKIMAFPLQNGPQGQNRKNFTLSDPQLGLALKEVGNFVKVLYKHIGDDFLNYLPENILSKCLNLNAAEIQSFCEALKQREGKMWVSFIRQFYGPRMIA